MDTAELRLAMIHAVLTLAQVEIDDVDAIHLLHVFIVLTAIDVFRHQLRRAEEDALEIGIFGLSLHLDQQQFTAVILSKNIDTVQLGILMVFVTLTLQQAVYLDRRLQQR